MCFWKIGKKKKKTKTKFLIFEIYIDFEKHIFEVIYKFSFQVFCIFKINKRRKQSLFFLLYTSIISQCKILKLIFLLYLYLINVTNSKYFYYKSNMNIFQLIKSQI